MDLKYALVTSSDDPASLNMAEYLRENSLFRRKESQIQAQKEFNSVLHQKVKLITFDKSLLFITQDDLSEIEADYFIFLSRHKSTSKIPAITCHFTGNFSHNAFGGAIGELSIACPTLQKVLLRGFFSQKDKLQGYDITLEASHHGPTSIQRPIVFVEIGSAEEQWQDKNAISFVCNCLLKTLKENISHGGKVGIGLGGNHYPSKFNDLVFNTDYSIAAIAPKHNLPFVDNKMLAQMIDKSAEKVNYIFIDHKGLGKEKARIIDLVSTFSLEVIKL